MKALLSAIYRARRKGLLRLKAASNPIRLQCLGSDCGLCCEVTGGGVVVDPSARKVIPSRLVEEHSDGSTVLKSCGGVCAALVDKKCSIYDLRPSGCREYPWYNVDGDLYYDAGCPGMLFDRDERPRPQTLTPIQQYFSAPNWIGKLIFWWIIER